MCSRASRNPDTQGDVHTYISHLMIVSALVIENGGSEVPLRDIFDEPRLHVTAWVVARKVLLACEPRNVTRLLALVRDQNIPYPIGARKPRVYSSRVVLAVAHMALPPITQALQLLPRSAVAGGLRFAVPQDRDKVPAG